MAVLLILAGGVESGALTWAIGVMMMPAFTAVSIMCMKKAELFIGQSRTSARPVRVTVISSEAAHKLPGVRQRLDPAA